ncbi:glycosyltransferase [uncultured Acetobacteroides sp.]|uniref:glycosyltransferase n=1 Tax=uncultured Acetobacteroides sp. TaxID=1760811 RepID=UPI0029F52EB6|nr:glycosyltransferase [uncultured Acetobacteroides sp.]
MNNIKVCHFTCAHDDNDVRIFSKECKSLHEAGYDVYLVAPGNREIRVENGIKIINVKVSRNPLMRVLSSSRKVYKKALELNANIYHFHDIELFWYGIKLKRKGYKVIFDSHEDWIGYINDIKWLPSVVKYLFVKYIKYKYKIKLNKFDAVITVSPHIVDSLKINTPNVFLVTNYPTINNGDMNQVNYAKYLDREKIICYAGTVYENSNQDKILYAIQNIEEIKYWVVGDISQAYKERIVGLDFKNKILFIDRVSKPELINIYNKVIVGVVLFDYSKNCGGTKGTMGNNKIFEYMMSGLPIICTDFEDWKELIVDKYNCGICVAPDNIIELENAINKLIQDKSLAYEMGQNGQRAVLEEFNWSTQERVLLNIYEKILIN